jgi:hypothetical protein
MWEMRRDEKFNKCMKKGHSFKMLCLEPMTETQWWHQGPGRGHTTPIRLRSPALHMAHILSLLTSSLAFLQQEGYTEKLYSKLPFLEIPTLHTQKRIQSPGSSKLACVVF